MSLLETKEAGGNVHREPVINRVGLLQPPRWSDLHRLEGERGEISSRHGLMIFCTIYGLSNIIQGILKNDIFLDAIGVAALVCAYHASKCADY